MDKLLLNEDLERAAFENWYSEGSLNCRSIERSGAGYKLINTQVSWNVWKARATIQQACGEYICSKCGLRQSLGGDEKHDF